MTIRLPTLLTAVLVATTAACSSGSSDQQVEASATTALPQGNEVVRLDPAEFTIHIDNPYWPMSPGTRWTYRDTEDGTVQRVVVIVTRETERLANGVTARVVRDTVSENGRVVEDTRDWYAQDANGNIWYLGEDTAEFDHGVLETREGSFEAGVDGAQAGIIVPASPEPGMNYRQEFYSGHAEDHGGVLSTTELAGVPAGFYRDALLTRDLNGLEPKVEELKLYAKGVGPVLTLTTSGGTGREELIRMDIASASAGTGPLGHPRR